MIVFGPSASPFVRKVLVFAAEKGIEVESRAGGPGSPPDPAFLAASPFGKIPAFQDGDFAISDSSAIVAYLEKTKADPELIPTERCANARTIWFDEFADTILAAPVTTMFFNRVVARLMGREGSLEAADKAEAEALPKALAYLEGVIPASGFLVEDRLTLADIAVAAPFANLGHMGCDAAAKGYPKTAAWAAAILARPSFAKLIAAEKAMFGG